MQERVVSWLLCASAAAVAAQADEIRTSEQRFELAWSTTAAAVRKSYTPFTKEQLDKELSRSKAIKFQDPCTFEKSKDYKCYVVNWGIVYIPPYPFALLPYRRGARDGTGETWVPVDDVNQGRHELANLRQLAETGATFDCLGVFSCVIVEGFNEAQQPSEITYAICQRARVGSVLGAPHSCRQIAIIHGEEIWLNAITRGEYEEAARGLPDFSVRIHGIPPHHVLPKNDDVAKAIGSAFRSSPLALESQAFGDDTVIAAAAFRVSPVLDGWREIVTVRVDLERETGTWRGPEFIGLITSTTLYVNRQNTSAPKDWSLPTQQQEVLYLDRIRGQIRVGLETICKNAKWTNPEDLSCEL